MKQLELNIPEAREARDSGMQQAEAHANQVDPGWSDKAYDMLKDWLSRWPIGFKFQIEGFRQVAQIRGLPDPPTARSFGSIAVKARKEGLIRSNGQKPTSSPTAHRCYSNEWEKI